MSKSSRISILNIMSFRFCFIKVLTTSAKLIWHGIVAWEIWSSTICKQFKISGVIYISMNHNQYLIVKNLIVRVILVQTFHFNSIETLLEVYTDLIWTFGSTKVISEDITASWRRSCLWNHVDYPPLEVVLVSPGRWITRSVHGYDHIAHSKIRQ